MVRCRTKADLVIAIDDTDNAEEGGTGRVAREIARRLSERLSIWGVSRHQFVVLPEIPYTRNNSGNAIHVLSPVAHAAALADEVGEWLRELCLPESDPGLCVTRSEALLDADLGRAAQARVVTRDEVRGAAEAAGVILRHPCATDDGIVGAFAGACLASSGNDGRFVEVGGMRLLSGRLTVQEVLAAGGDEVRSVEGKVLTHGDMVAERLRPALQRGKCVVYCARTNGGGWAPIVGAPGDQTKEDRTNVRE